jgi:hypothetical protein
MDFNNLDKIFNLIYESKYDELKNFDIKDINIVKKIKFPNYKIDIEPTTNLKENRINSCYFRNKLIEKFKSCALTNINHNLCDAAHLLPYADCDYNEKSDIKNGILLNKNMHCAFDKNYFIIDEKSCRIKIIYKNVNESIIKDLELHKINNKYIHKLDNDRSKYFLKKRNKKIEI